MKSWEGQACHLRCSLKLNLTVNWKYTHLCLSAGPSCPLHYLRYWETLFPQWLPIAAMLLSASETMWHKSLLHWGWHHKEERISPTLCGVTTIGKYQLWNGRAFSQSLSIWRFFKPCTDLMRSGGRRECMNDLRLYTHSLCPFLNLWETIWVPAIIEFFPAPIMISVKLRQLIGSKVEWKLQGR